MEDRSLIAEIVKAYAVGEIVYLKLNNWKWIIVGNVLFIDPVYRDTP
jgi:hypothetical protein